MEYKKHTHFGVYGIFIKSDEILLIKKANGPYKGLLDLPGGSLEFGEKIEKALVREFKEETGFDILDYTLKDVFSTVVNWNMNNNLIKINHIGVFYIINKYSGSIIKNNIIDDQNDDSLGASFYKISDLKKEMVSNITVIALEKMGYEIK